MHVRPNRSVRLRIACALVAGVALGLQIGCITTRWTELRRRPFNPLAQQLALDSRSGPRPTPRTLQTLRRKNLAELAEDSPQVVLASLQEIALEEPTADNVYAIAEVAYVQAQSEKRSSHQRAMHLYGTAVANAYFYLFDTSLRRGRSPYDPRFRRACDLYNNSLEQTMRFMQSHGKLQPGSTRTMETEGQVFDITIAARGTWHERNFQELKFVSDFKVKELTNHYRNYGLGVPMIAVYRSQGGNSNADRFYPPGMSFPVTAFLRVVGSTVDHENPSQVRHQCVLELHDPTVISEVMVGSETVPLETDLTTPLAYSLENPAFQRANVPTRGLRDFEKSVAESGLYMLEPFDQNKIPVVMVHGFWSSLVTWMEMFNDLRGSPEIRDNYQFWFYLYPTGPPYWFTAAHFRSQLAKARTALDPDHTTAAMDQMVLVGHSMGGLIATMQTIETEDEMWKLVSDHPLDRVVCDPVTRKNMANAFFFGPNPSVRRVVTIATPHHGSNFSNVTTQWLGRKFIGLPDQLLTFQKRLFQQNPQLLAKDSLLSMTTAVEALDTSSPAWEFFANAARAPWVTYHNIIGSLEATKVLRAVAGKSDGIIKIESARIPYAESEITVASEHTQVHRQPAAILEVRRILLQHLAEIEATQSLARPHGMVSQVD
jgi:pimeloyl-ACP methyl ester carboxylesterase